MSEKLREKLNKDLMHARLLNWGRWLRYDSTVARLGYPTQCPFVFSPRRGALIADLDAQHIEWIVSSLYVSGLELCELHAFVLRVEYAEKSDSCMPHVSQRAEDVRRRFKRPCGRSRYYDHVVNAKKAIQVFAESIK